MCRSRQQALLLVNSYNSYRGSNFENLVTGIELDTFIRKVPVLTFLPSVYTCRLDHILPVDKKAVNP